MAVGLRFAFVELEDLWPACAVAECSVGDPPQRVMDPVFWRPHHHRPRPGGCANGDLLACGDSGGVGDDWEVLCGCFVEVSAGWPGWGGRSNRGTGSSRWRVGGCGAGALSHQRDQERADEYGRDPTHRPDPRQVSHVNVSNEFDRAPDHVQGEECPRQPGCAGQDVQQERGGQRREQHGLDVVPGR